MKKLLFIATLIFAISCSKDNGKLDPSAVVSIRPAASSQLTTKASPYLSNKEIVKQADDMVVYDEQAQNKYGIRGFAEKQRDTINLRLLMWGTDIIDQYGNYVPYFIESKDIIIRRIINKGQWPPKYDTIAYIPQSVMNNAKYLIKGAYDAKDYTQCYKLFDEAFSFKPVTGYEWRELKKQEGD